MPADSNHPSLDSDHNHFMCAFDEQISHQMSQPQMPQLIAYPQEIADNSADGAAHEVGEEEEEDEMEEDDEELVDECAEEYGDDGEQRRGANEEMLDGNGGGGGAGPSGGGRSKRQSGE